MNDEITVLIADDHPIFRKGLREVICSEPSLRLVGEVEDGLSALQMIREKKPAVAVLDLDLPRLSGLDVARQSKRDNLPTACLILTMHKEEDLFNAAMDLGILGYVLKENVASVLLLGIERVAAGLPYLCPSVSAYVLHRHAAARTLAQRKPGLEDLTPTQRRILQLIAADRTSKEIADDLGISYRTVENHRANICEKLDLHGSHSLLKFAFDNKSRL